MSAVRAPILPLFQDPYHTARQLFAEVPEFMSSEEAQSMSHSEMEREVEDRVRQVMRALFQGWLDERAGAEVQEPVVDADGEERTRQRIQSTDLATVFGTVTVRRTAYSAEGKASLRPLDAHLNLPAERYSHELRHRAALEASKSSFEETVETLARYTGSPVAKRQVQELVNRAAQDFDAFYAMRQQTSVAGEQHTTEQDGSILVITADGKGVVMHKKDLRPETRAAAERNQTTLGDRVNRAKKRNRKRMAAVASVYTVEPYVRTPEQVFRALARLRPTSVDGTPPKRPRPQRKRVWASLEKTPEEVLDEAFLEALDRDPDRERTWAAVVDGAEHQLDLLECLAAAYGVSLIIVLDVFHVLSYVWKAGRALEGDNDERVDAWVLERMRKLLEGRSAHVAAGMRRSATRRQLTAAKREPIDTCADYLLKYQDYLNYHEYLAAGLPIASGVIEGACRHLVKDRMEITGARWRLRTAEAVLRLRALRASGDFDAYWKLREDREQERNHLALYARGKVPDLVKPEAEQAPRPGA